MKTERRLKELGIEIAPATSPLANYVNAVRTGNLLYLAGKGPGLPGQPMPAGKVGRDGPVQPHGGQVHAQARSGRRAQVNQIAKREHGAERTAQRIGGFQ